MRGRFRSHSTAPSEGSRVKLQLLLLGLVTALVLPSTARAQDCSKSIAAGNGIYSQGKFEDAIGCYQSFIDAQTSNSKQYRTVAKARFWQANCYTRLKRFGAADTAFADVVARIGDSLGIEEGIKARYYIALSKYLDALADNDLGRRTTKLEDKAAPAFKEVTDWLTPDKIATSPKESRDLYTILRESAVYMQHDCVAEAGSFSYERMFSDKEAAPVQDRFARAAAGFDALAKVTPRPDMKAAAGVMAGETKIWDGKITQLLHGTESAGKNR